MLMLLQLAGASELKTCDFVDSAEVHIVDILFFCRDPCSTADLNTYKSLA